MPGRRCSTHDWGLNDVRFGLLQSSDVWLRLFESNDVLFLLCSTLPGLVRLWSNLFDFTGHFSTLFDFVCLYRNFFIFTGNRPKRPELQRNSDIICQIMFEKRQPGQPPNIIESSTNLCFADSYIPSSVVGLTFQSTRQKKGMFRCI